MQDVLIITSYFPPETGAASNRIFQLSNGLLNRGFNVTVITPLPNYPTGKIFKEYKRKFKHTTTEHNITVHRLWLFASNSKNKLLRLFAMLSYSFSLIWFFLWHKIPKKIIVQSPPLLVAFTCVLFLSSKKRKVILNVSDLWPIAGLELGAFKKNFSYRVLEKIEQYNYKKADLILGQSEEILEHISKHYPNKNTFLYRNYPDFKIPEIKHSIASNDKIRLVYAGLLGVAQGIFNLCEKLDYSIIEFHIYGAGAEQSKIESLISSKPHLPITFYGQLPREQLHGELLKYDIAIIPLLNRIYGSVPSKIFEFARLGLPLLYFGGGEGETIVEENKLGWVAKAGNYEDLNRVLLSIKKRDVTTQLKSKIQETARVQFDFNHQLNTLIENI